MTDTQERRRAFVNQEVAIRLKGKKVSRKMLSRVFRVAWREAKRKIR
jgi:hypothetical protein